MAATAAMALALCCCRASVDGKCAPGDAQRAVDSAASGVDDDEDGLDDALEDQAARAYLPYLAHHPDDACPLAGLVFRARPHPDNPALIFIVYSQLYARDCGLNGHIGDDEAFGVTVDPSRPPPAGLVAMTAISHQDTVCQKVTTCGTCPGMNACDIVDDTPVVYCSKDKHGSVVDIGAGCSLGSCLESCAPSPTPADLPLVNAGEPAHPLVHDLTDQGFIHAGWDASLQHFDPWSPHPFGGAGVIAGDLTDDRFITPACTCRE